MYFIRVHDPTKFPTQWESTSVRNVTMNAPRFFNMILKLFVIKSEM